MYVFFSKKSTLHINFCITRLFTITYRSYNAIHRIKVSASKPKPSRNYTFPSKTHEIQFQPISIYR